jgi:hypothetical protein
LITLIEDVIPSLMSVSSPLNYQQSYHIGVVCNHSILLASLSEFDLETLKESLANTIQPISQLFNQGALLEHHMGFLKGLLVNPKLVELL